MKIFDVIGICVITQQKISKKKTDYRRRIIDEHEKVLCKNRSNSKWD